MPKKNKDQKETLELRRRLEALQAELAAYKRGEVPPVVTTRQQDHRAAHFSLPAAKTESRRDTADEQTTSQPSTIFLTDVHYLKQDFKKTVFISFVIVGAVVALRVFTKL